MGELRWSLSDPELDILGRVGLGAIALALDAAEQLQHDLSPLVGRFGRSEIELSWTASVTDEEALTRLVEWVWQARNAPRGQAAKDGLGVLFFPGIHREVLDDPTERLVEHSGVLSTFLQHPRVQPKTKPKDTEWRIDDRVVRLRYVEPTGEIAYVKDFKKQLFTRKRLVSRDVTLSSYFRPGATARHPGEESWSGSVREAIPLFCAPTACFYLQVRGADWVVVAPDPRDLEEFVHRRPLVRLAHRGMVAASAADAALRVLVAMRARAATRQLERGRSERQECLVLKVGEVAWNRQSVRNGALTVKPTEETVTAYETVERHLSNRLQERSKDGTFFVRVPTPRATIADNLLDGSYWYRNLFEVPRELREQLEKNRSAGESAQRTWFRWMRIYRKELLAVMADLDELKMPGSENDEIFRDAFHTALRNLYGREAEQAKRGSRNVLDRLADRTEKIRRDLSKAQTREHLRGVLAELFAEAGRNHALQAHAAVVWRFIDSDAWRRARDLALFCLATYARAADRDEVTPNEEGEAEG